MLTCTICGEEIKRSEHEKAFAYTCGCPDITFKFKKGGITRKVPKDQYEKMKNMIRKLMSK